MLKYWLSVTELNLHCYSRKQRKKMEIVSSIWQKVVQEHFKNKTSGLNYILFWIDSPKWHHKCHAKFWESCIIHPRLRMHFLPRLKCLQLCKIWKRFNYFLPCFWLGFINVRVIYVQYMSFLYKRIKDKLKLITSELETLTNYHR